MSNKETSSSVPSVSQSPGGLRRQTQKRPDGPGRLTPGPKLENLPQKHQRDDHRRRFKIQPNLAGVISKRRRENSAERETTTRLLQGRPFQPQRDEGEPHSTWRVTTAPPCARSKTGLIARRSTHQAVAAATESGVALSKT